MHRLFYSIPAEAWFVAVQDDNSGDVLTTLPLAYFENFHGHVSALNRRKARKLAREFEAKKLERQNVEEAAQAARLAAKQKAAESQGRVTAGWKMTAIFHEDGTRRNLNLGRTPLDYGDPELWGAAMLFMFGFGSGWTPCAFPPNIKCRLGGKSQAGSARGYFDGKSDS